MFVLEVVVVLFVPAQIGPRRPAHPQHVASVPAIAQIEAQGATQFQPLWTSCRQLGRFVGCTLQSNDPSHCNDSLKGARIVEINEEGRAVALHVACIRPSNQNPNRANVHIHDQRSEQPQIMAGTND